MTLLSSGPRVAPSPVPLLLRAEDANAARAQRAGDLARVSRGVYAPADAWAALAPWERYIARVHAVARTHPEAVFVLESGAALRGLPLFGEPPDVHILLPTPTKSRTMPGVRLHTTERMPDVERVDGILVATTSEIVVGISRTRHPAVALAVAGFALRADPTLTVESLAAASARRPTTRGVRALQWVLERATPVPESPLEHVSIAAVEWLGFPPPELQRWFRDDADGDHDRVDLWWERWRIAGEADGAIKFSGALGDARLALQERNARDARLLRRGVRATAHWGMGDLAEPEQLRAILRAAGLPLIAPQQTAPLASLGPALRGLPATARLPRR